MNKLSVAMDVKKVESEDKVVVNKLSETKVVTKLESVANVFTNKESLAKPSNATSSLVPSSMPIVNVDWLKTEPLMF